MDCACTIHPYLKSLADIPSSPGSPLMKSCKGGLQLRLFFVTLDKCRAVHIYSRSEPIFGPYLHIPNISCIIAILFYTILHHFNSISLVEKRSITGHILR